MQPAATNLYYNKNKTLASVYVSVDLAANWARFMKLIF
jgi:hypothetical protein